MKVEEALKIVYENTIGDNSILRELRGGKGLNQQSYKLLIEAMKKLIEEYKDKSEVPKKLALCFVDINNYFYFNKGKYTEEEEKELEDAVHEISYLAEKLFA
ncbi:hypothetical protein AMS59_01910 [Lysinibacillus sp. FJAT-14745]|uniref:hypothetical protein n=1 Tax=Lysinibacillus sp. FJAT-14745 TaxID=1704289 RepID=UPI0006ABD779|nr:hypothetical protein [Lysinibacillus sp. FJAT-14745]KOP80181.1 hypothetical protein AMS59_01910 [Lysinibacillus sp. FJAT-14745]